MRTTLAMTLAGLLAAGVWILIEPKVGAASQHPAAAAASAPGTPASSAAAAPASAPARAMDPPGAGPRMVR